MPVLASIALIPGWRARRWVATVGGNGPEIGPGWLSIVVV
jgi:hypothetical protein